MATFYVDGSHYQGEMRLDGANLVVWKATEGTDWTDPTYAAQREQCRAKGILFAAYHYLHGGNVLEQAAHAYAVVGPDVPLMIDCEKAPDGTPNPQLGDILSFAVAYREKGGTVHLVYVPRWYWQDFMRTPSLRSLPANGLYLVSSDYATYTDTGPGWGEYGGVVPMVWQFTDHAVLNNVALDANAYRGTIDQLWSLMTGGTTMSVPDLMQNTAFKEMAFRIEMLAYNLPAQRDGVYKDHPNPVRAELAALHDGLNAVLAHLDLPPLPPMAEPQDLAATDPATP